MPSRTSRRAIAALALVLVAVAWPGRPSRAEESRPEPRVVIGLPTIRGSMPRDWFMRHFVRHKHDIGSCLALELAGMVRVTVRIVIAPTGRVLTAQLAGGSVGPLTESCLIQEIESIDFGSHPAGVDIIELPIAYIVAAPAPP